jgi:nucleotide-binding universal stress UspA family protein
MYNTILIPVDFSHEEQTVDALKKAKKLVGSGDIILLHVMEDVPTYIMNQLPQGIDLMKANHAQSGLKALAEKAGVDARIEVLKGGSYNSILESADDNKVDLIIINSHRPGLQDYLLGSTAAKVVRHAVCAVLVER